MSQPLPFELDHLADERDPSNMRHDEPHASARLVVDEAMTLVAKDAK